MTRGREFSPDVPTPPEYLPRTPFGPPNKLTLLQTLRAEGQGKQSIHFPIPPILKPEQVEKTLRNYPVIWRPYLCGDDGTADSIIVDFYRSPIQTEAGKEPFLPDLEQVTKTNPEIEHLMNILNINPLGLKIKWFPQLYAADTTSHDLITTAGIPPSGNTPETIDVEVTRIQPSFILDGIGFNRSDYEKFTFTYDGSHLPNSDARHYMSKQAQEAQRWHSSVSDYLNKLGFGRYFVCEFIKNDYENLILVQVRILPPQWEYHIKRRSARKLRRQENAINKKGDGLCFSYNEDLPQNAQNARMILANMRTPPANITFSWSTDKHKIQHGALAVMLATVSTGGTVYLPEPDKD